MAKPRVAEPRVLRLSIRLTDRERASWQQAADGEGRSLGDFIRRAVNRSATGARKLRHYGSDPAQYVDAVKDRKKP